MFVPSVECVSSGWRVNRVRWGCLIGLTKLKQVPELRKCLTLTTDEDQVFEMRNKRRNYQLKIMFSDRPLILITTLNRN